MTKKEFIAIVMLCLLAAVFCRPGFADKIYLKDGKVYDGKLLGRSQKRFLFSVDIEGVSFRMSFFPEEVEKLELGKDTVEEQIPYLKEVESFKVEVKEETPKVYEMSLYKESQKETDGAAFSERELKGALSEEEAEYYRRFNNILKKYVDKFSVIQNIYLNLTTATREDFAEAKQYMDELYFELNNIFVAGAFQKSHADYLESVKANYLAFHALERGMLEEASRQIKLSEEKKEQSMSAFRKIIVERMDSTLGSSQQEKNQEAGALLRRGPTI